MDSGEFDPQSFGEVKARIAAAEREAEHARQDRGELFRALNAFSQNQAVLSAKLDRNHEAVSEFTKQCLSCRADIQRISARVTATEKGLETATLRRKIGAPAASKKLWDKPIGEWLFDILAGGLKVAGTAAVVYLLLEVAGNAGV
jgi:hypothetical protein